jgi:hypothetical protein
MTIPFLNTAFNWVAPPINYPHLIMKLVSTLALSLGALMATSQAGLILTAIYDGSGSTPKGVELYVTSTGSYTGWTLDIESNANSGFGTGYIFDATEYTVGDFLYVTSTPADSTLVTVGGTIITDNSFNQNGDDRIRLTDGTNVIDQIGVSGTDGTGSAWEYTDSYGVRNSGTTANGSFTIADWTFPGPDTLDNNGNSELTTVLGTYTIPEPTAALLGSLGLLGLIRRRR